MRRPRTRRHQQVAVERQAERRPQMVEAGAHAWLAVLWTCLWPASQ